MEVIPAIDLIDGKCVRLNQGDYASRKVYSERPVDTARRFEDAGVRRLHMVDLDGAKAGRVVNHRVLEQVAAKTSLVIDFGGGIASDEDLRIAFESGARLVSLGSVCVKQPAKFKEWLARLGPEQIILVADVKDRRVRVSGWLEGTELEVVPFIRDHVAGGVSYVLCTDIARDGMMQGPATELYRELLGEVPAQKLIASGGVRNLRDLAELAEAGAWGVVLGKSLYEGTISLEELRMFIDRGA